MLSCETNLSHLGIIDRDVMGTYDLFRLIVLGCFGCNVGMICFIVEAVLCLTWIALGSIIHK